MRRLLALAGLLLGPAGLWVLDEPLAGVDDEGRERIAGAVDAACARGVAVLVAGHLAEVSALESRRPRELRLGQ
jgi:ABC-type transport system involved in cytochrome c biogenesis ATPase subunit